MISTAFPDLIITYYPATTDPTSTRARYCGLAYPKTQRWHDTASTNSYIYYNQTDPFYDGSNDGIMYGYSGGDSPTGYEYSPAENAANLYTYCTSKTGTSDTWSNYGGSCTNYQFIPTDSDWALGFYNWGQQMPWYWVGPTWFSATSYSNSSSPQGYLHVVVGDLSNTTQFNNVYNVLNPHANDSAGYMSCTASNKNQCVDSNQLPYIVNGSNTPTAGTLKTALSYFNGQYSGQSSPITSVCQKNYIIFVTDGLPSTKLDGSQPLDFRSSCPRCLRSLTIFRRTCRAHSAAQPKHFPSKLMFSGVGLTSDAKANLDQMAVHGGTPTSTGHAYYADDPSQLTDALQTIMIDLLGRVSAGSAISILSEGQTQNGANMLQGVFYPTKYFGTTTISWPGYLYDYWFYYSYGL